MKIISSYRIASGCVCACLAAALCSCATTHEERVAEMQTFFAGGSAKPDKRVVKAGSPRPEASSAEKPASAARGVTSEPPREPGRGDPKEIEAYAGRMEPQRYDGDYQPNDHLSKIMRHRRSAEREARHQPPPQGPPPIDSAVEKSDEPEDAPMPPERSVVKTASSLTNEKPERSGQLPELDGADRADSPIDKSAASAAAEDDLVGPTDSDRHHPAPLPAAPSKVVAPGSSEPARGAAPDDLPRLTELKVSAAPAVEEKAETSHDEKAEAFKPSPLQREPAPAVTPAKPSAKANEPAAAAEPADAFAARLERQRELVKKDPNNIEEQFRLRLLYVIDGQDERALAPVEGVDSDVEEIITAHVRTLIAARSSSGRDPATWANRQLELIEELRGQMRARADLQIPRVVLCTSFEGYGRYEPIEPAEFRAGREHRVVIYVEVENLKIDRTKSGRYRTLLSVRATLMNEQGQVFIDHLDENIEELSRRPLHDFYVGFPPIAIPPTLPVGNYTLKVEIEDVLGGKINSQTTKFKIVP